MKKSDVRIEITVKLKNTGKKYTKEQIKRMETNLEKECAGYLKILLDPKISEALFGLVKKHETES